MLRLTLVLFLFIGSTLAGAGVVAALTMGLYDARPIVIVAALGALIALPVSWLVARHLENG